MGMEVQIRKVENGYVVTRHNGHVSEFICANFGEVIDKQALFFGELETHEVTIDAEVADINQKLRSVK